MVNSHSFDFNNQSVEQMYMDKLEKFKVEALNTMIGLNDRQLFLES